MRARGVQFSMNVVDLFTIFSVLFGGCVGSFLNVCIFRIPAEGMTVWRPKGSFCPRCETPIAAKDNIPVLAWLALRGKCRTCREPIPVRYPLIEFVTAMMFLGLWLRFGPTTEEAVMTASAWLPVLFWWVVFSLMLVISMIDIDLQIIPDELSVTGGALLLLVAPFIPGVPYDLWLVAPVIETLGTSGEGLLPDARLALQVPLALALGALAMFLMRRFNRDYEGKVRTWWQTRWAGAVGIALGVLVGGWLADPRWLAEAFAQKLTASLLGAAVGSGVIYSIGRIGTLAFRKEAMGFGDVKLMGLLGALVGAKFVLLSIFLASFLGSVIGLWIRFATLKPEIPFGPFLCAGAAILIVAESGVHDVIEWYLALLQPE